jgi:hypothetical protein
LSSGRPADLRRPVCLSSARPSAALGTAVRGLDLVRLCEATGPGSTCSFSGVLSDIGNVRRPDRTCQM